MPLKNNRPALVGVTGGIGSGKSVVCQIFECLNVPVYYADTRAKWLMNNSLQLKHKIIQRFGEESYVDGHLNRSFLAKNVFSNTQQLEDLNQLVHPAVALDGQEWQNDNAKHPLLVKEAALLYETGSYRQLDHTIVVAADLDTRVNRVILRDPHRSKEEVLKIIEKQLLQEDKIARADFVIFNNDGDSLIEQVYSFLQQYDLKLK